ncbi:MAG: hypothetical protein ACJ79S_03515 [Gemmatimonadaceae bacterium]
MPDTNHEHFSDLPKHDPRELTYRDLERLDAEQALTHRSERAGPIRRQRFAKDDRRSSERIGDPDHSASSEWLTAREREERWPIG